MATAVAIDDNAERGKKNYLLLFPSGVELDNRVFSGDSSGKININLVPMKEDSNENEFQLDLKALGVYWVVAEKHSARRITTSAGKADLKGMFSP